MSPRERKLVVVAILPILLRPPLIPHSAAIRNRSGWRRSEVSMAAEVKWARSQRRQAFARAVTCAIFVVFSTTSESQVSGPQSQGIAVKADAASLCALVGKMQVIG